MPSPRALLLIRLLHTLIWVILAGFVLAIPVAGWMGAYTPVLWLTLAILAEAAVLAINRWRCPLTSLAERFSASHEPGFDIFLPVWLAKNNKLIFGTLFVLGEVFVLALAASGRR